MKRGFDAEAFDRQLDDLPVIDSLTELLCLDPEDLGCGRADEHRIIPSQFGNRVGCLHEPAIIGIASIIERSIHGEEHFQAIVGCRFKFRLRFFNQGCGLPGFEGGRQCYFTGLTIESFTDGPGPALTEFRSIPCQPGT
jgi:hypothetical protein